MAVKEAKARIKINELLIKAGWRFEDNETGKANISLEHRGKKLKARNSDLGDDFENAPEGFIEPKGVYWKPWRVMAWLF